jgi:hypothetical protein
MQLLLSRVECGANTHYQPAPPPKNTVILFNLLVWANLWCWERKWQPAEEWTVLLLSAASHGRRSSLVCFGPDYSRLYISHFCTKCAQCVCTNTQLSLRHTQSDCKQTHVTAKYNTEETLRAQPPFLFEVVFMQDTSSIYWHCANLWFIWRCWQKHRHIISEYELDVIGGIVNNIRTLARGVRVISRIYSVRMFRTISRPF